MTEDKDPKKLRLNPDKIIQSPEDAARTMGEYYSTMGNCALNIAIALDKIAYNTEYLLIELSDIKDNMNKQGLSEGWLTQTDIEEREEEEDKPKPPNASA